MVWVCIDNDKGRGPTLLLVTGFSARLIPGARLVRYPGSGHGFLFQDAQQFVAELRSFLGQSNVGLMPNRKRVSR
jgi:pimeloyl-ACP methyl ester carboxylesterase